jgi:hypothetical protein
MKTIGTSTLLNVSLTLCILIPTNLFGQFIPDLDAYEAEDTVCVWDETVSFTTTKGYTAYQTTDNTFNGPIDSNYCVSLKSDEDYYGLSFQPSDFDPSRSIYLKAELNADNKIPLTKNSVYTISDYFTDYTEGVLFGNDCPDLICTGIIIGIEIPDSTLTSDTIRWHLLSGDTYNYNSCFPTEKFDNQYLSTFIFKFTFDPTLAPEMVTNGYPPDIHEVYDVYPITDLTEANGLYVDEIYIIEDYNFIGSLVGLLQYDAPTYPSASNFDYIDVSPNPNPAEVTSIELLINEYYTLLAQPYIQLRGAQIEGDTLRHEVNLVNNGGTFCMGVAEMIFDGNTHYIFRSGAIDLYSPMSCLMFKNGASIQVDDNAHLSYGINGTGVLGLGSGGTIKIGNNASFTINNRVSIIKNPNSTFSGDIYMTLNEGSKLIFGEGATISNDEKSVTGGHLCIYMNGGEIDMSKLDDFSRQLIRLIYPSEENTMSKNMHIYPNPAQNDVIVEVVSAANINGSITITSANGERILTQNYELENGINAIKIPITGLKSGVYTITCTTSLENGSIQFVKL